MKHLDKWARNFGFADFDTYVRAGGSILDARRDILSRIAALQAAISALDSMTPPPRFAPSGEIGGQSKAFSEMARGITRPESLEPDEPPDPHNAHPQGDEA